MSSRQGGLHSTIVRCRGVTSHSTLTWLRTCSGTRCWHQRRTRAISSSGRPASVTLTVWQQYSRERPDLPPAGLAPPASPRKRPASNVSFSALLPERKIFPLRQRRRKPRCAPGCLSLSAAAGRSAAINPARLRGNAGSCRREWFYLDGALYPVAQLEGCDRVWLLRLMALRSR